MNGAENVMSDDVLWQRVDELRNQQANTDRELAVLVQRTNAMEARTDRTMSELAESRAESRQAMSEISRTLMEVRDWQTRHDGRSEGKGWSESLQRWAIPAIISFLALAKTMGWI